MAFDRMKAVYSAFYFCFLIKTASCQVRLGDVVGSRNEYPYMAKINIWYINNDLRYPHQPPYQTVETCGGSVLSKHFIMTAAHCVMPVVRESNYLTAYRNQARVRLGVDPQHLNRYMQEFWLNNANNFVLHHDFEIVRNSDIALLRTNEEIRIDNFNIARALISNEGSVSEEGWECDVAGWGHSTKEEIVAGLMSTVLKNAKNTILSRRFCHIPRQLEVINTEICTGGDLGFHWIWRRAFNNFRQNWYYITHGNLFQERLAPSATPGDSGDRYHVARSRDLFTAASTNPSTH